MPDEAAATSAEVREHRIELRKEALTMALYVAICLMAALLAIPETAIEHSNVLGLIWGITLGLALAHWFAFRVSARMVGSGSIHSSDLQLVAAQLLAAAGVAFVASMTALVLPDAVELEDAELLLAGLIALIGFGVARGAGASRFRAVVYAVLVLVGAVAIAVLKNLLAGH
jgi:hypothetical protein